MARVLVRVVVEAVVEEVGVEDAHVGERGGAHGALADGHGHHLFLVGWAARRVVLYVLSSIELFPFFGTALDPKKATKRMEDFGAFLLLGKSAARLGDHGANTNGDKQKIERGRRLRAAVRKWTTRRLTARAYCGAAGDRRRAVIGVLSDNYTSWPFALRRAGFSHHEGAVYRYPP